MDSPRVVVAGAGAAGLASAAMLKRRGIPTVVLERGESVGTSWRHRYDSLRLNTLRWSSALPGYRLERRYGRWPSRDEWVAYLERYARHQDLDVRFGVQLERVERTGGGWALETSEGRIDTANVVIALGLDHDPHMPDWPGRDGFEGELIHAAAYRNPTPFAGREVLLVGPGNTGSEIAWDLVRGGATLPVRCSMRNPPNIVNREQFGMPILNLLALVTERVPTPIYDANARLIQRLLFGDLKPYGVGRSRYGMKQNVFERGIAPAIDDGFVSALKDGRIEIVPVIERFDGAEVVLAGGRHLRPDAVICATGYQRGLEPIVGHLGVIEPRLGLPRIREGRADPAHPGLYFAGYEPGLAGTLRRFKYEARRIARDVSRRSSRSSSGAQVPSYA